MAGARWAPLVVAGSVGLGLVVAVKLATGTSSGPAAGRAPGPSASSGNCTVVHLTASSEKAAILTAVAKDFASHRVGGRCVAVQVTSKASGAATDALARGWDEGRDGPRPDVWSPAASSWTGLLRQKTDAADRPDLVGGQALPSIASSPLVIAMPRPMATALGWPGKALGWGDVYRLARDPGGWASVGQPYGPCTLGKTNPNVSTSGLNATMGTYVAATGTSSDLTVANLADPKVQFYAKAVEDSVVHYGDTTLTFLSNLQRADDRGQGLGYISAVAVEEKSVWDYDQENPSGDPATWAGTRVRRSPWSRSTPRRGRCCRTPPTPSWTRPG